MISWKKALFILAIPLSCSATQVPCDGQHKGKAFNNTNIKSIINEHSIWLATKPLDDKKRINMCDTELIGIDLRNQVLDYINFSGSDLSEAKLSGIELNHATLFKTYFRESQLDNAKFYNAYLVDASFEYSNIKNADFRQANLANANLSFANAEKTVFRGANLKGANLMDTNLRGVDLSYADLTDANLSNADLTDAILEHAKLIRADLDKANLTNTSFIEADLTESLMTSVNMTNTNFESASLRNAIFQPKFGTQPDLIALSHSLHFNTIHLEDFKEGSASLNAIRREYKLINMRTMERNVTAVIKQEEMFNAWERGGWGYIESVFSYIMFYLTCDFGAAPGRPLRLVLLFIFLLSVPYRFALSYPTRHSAIIVNWEPKRFYHWNKVLSWGDEDRLCMVLKKRYAKGFWKKLRQQRHLAAQAIFFSFLTAFSIGWRDLNINNFLVRIQKRDYTLVGKGWVRVLAGTQSIISVYLMILWVLTYFGRPFEW